MGRIITEWLAISAAGAFVLITAIFAASFFPAWPLDPLAIMGDRHGSVYVQVKRGTITLFSEVDHDSPDAPTPWIVIPRDVIAPKLVSNRQLTVPGLAFQYCRFASGRPVWSLGVSLLIPSVFALVASILIIRRLRRVRRRDANTPVGAA
jgi:hypothetical protein